MTGLPVRYYAARPPPSLLRPGAVPPYPECLIIGEPGSAIDARATGTGRFFAHIDDVRAASATQLRHALARAAADYYEQENALDLSDVEYSHFDDEDSPRAPITFIGRAEGLLLDIDFFLDDFEDEAATAADIRCTVTPLLDRQRWNFISAEMDANYTVSPWLWHLRVEPRTRARTIGELYDRAWQILDLVEATTGRGLRRETVLELLRAGRPEVLVGQPEGDWLDVKSRDYDLSTDAGKISLAQDVARFANAEYGGILVVGMGTKKVGDQEVIRDVRPVPLDVRGVRRHRQAIDNRLFPPPDGLTVEEVLIGTGRLIILNVPLQEEELKPFLVQGAIVGSRTEGAFISIVRRRGESSIPITAAAIHATLAAGRALLRRGAMHGDAPIRRHADDRFGGPTDP